MESLSKEQEELLTLAVKIAKAHKQAGATEVGLCDVLREIIAHDHPDQGTGERESLVKCATSVRKELQAEKLTEQASLFKLEFKQKMNLTISEMAEIVKDCRASGRYMTNLEVEGYSFTIYEDGNVVLVKNLKPRDKGDGEYIIPRFVTIIGDGAFYDSGVDHNGRQYNAIEGIRCGTLVIPESIKCIEDYAFKGCNIENVRFEHSRDDSLSLGQGAFARTKIEWVKLPIRINVRNIALHNNHENALFGIASEQLRGGGASTVRFVFTQEHLDYFKNQGKGAWEILNRIAVSTEVQLDNVSEIPDQMFKGCQCLERVYVNGDLKKIGAGAFYGCENLKSVCEWDAKAAFDNKKGTDSWNAKIDVFEGKCNLAVEEVGAEAFQGCTKIQTVVLKDCKSVGNAAFKNMAFVKKDFTSHGLEEVDLSVCRKVGDCVFEGCVCLKEVDLVSCRKMGSYVFKDCVNLNPPRFGKFLNSVGKRIFMGHDYMRIPVPDAGTEKVLLFGISKEDKVDILVDPEAWD